MALQNFVVFCQTPNMNQPWVYIYALPFEPSSHLPPHPTPLGWYRALFEFPEPYSKFPLAIYFTYGRSHLSLFCPFLMVCYWSLQLLLLNCLFFSSIPFIFVSFCSTVVIYMPIYNCYIFLMDWPFCQCLMSLLVSFNVLCFKVCSDSC